MNQATSEEIERCNAVTPLTCVQNEYSMMKRMYEKEIKTCEKLVILLLLSILWLVDSYLEIKYEGDDVFRVITRFNKIMLFQNLY